MPLNDLLTLPGVAAQPDAVTDGYVFNGNRRRRTA